MAHDEPHALTTDRELVDIANYVCDYRIEDANAFAAARMIVTDTLAGSFDAVRHHECAKLLGPPVPGVKCAAGARVPGTIFLLDPAQAAFNIGCLIRWHDLNDTMTGAAASHPSDNLAGVLAIADYLGRRAPAKKLRMKDVLAWLTKAYEIQCLIGMSNTCFGNSGHIDHVLLTKVATAAVVTRMLGGDREQVINAASNAWLEPTLRLYRHAPGTGSRKSWAAADASAQAVRLAFMATKGEMGYPMALSTRKHGFYDVLNAGKPFEMTRPYGSFAIQNTMLKFVPSAMYGQSATECALKVHPLVRERIDQIEEVQVYVHSAVLRIMDRSGPLRNPADRDHCIQYVIAIGMIFGRLLVDDYEDDVAADRRIDALRARMKLIEDQQFTEGFSDPARKSSATGIQVRFKDGSVTPRIDIEYPVGHPSRRHESAAMFESKFVEALARHFPAAQCRKIIAMCDNQRRFERTTVDDFMSALVLRSPRASRKGKRQ